MNVIIMLSSLLVIAVITIIFLLINNKNNEKFCGTCQGIGNKVCTDREKLLKLYRDGILTENSKLVRFMTPPTTRPSTRPSPRPSPRPSTKFV